jgi:hypothetical protein
MSLGNNSTIVSLHYRRLIMLLASLPKKAKNMFTIQSLGKQTVLILQIYPLQQWCDELNIYH